MDKSARNWAIAIIVFAFAMLVMTGIGSRRQPRTIPPAPQTAQGEVIPPEDLKRFWNDELDNLIVGQLMKAQLPYTELNERYADTFRIVKERTGKPPSFSKTVGYHWASKLIEGSAGVDENGTAVVQLCVPAIRNTFEHFKARNLPDFRRDFQTYMIVVAMHETEHLRAIESTNTRPTHIDMTEESRAWSDTCKYVIDPLVTKYGMRITDHAAIYNAWLEAHGDTNHPAWQSAVQKFYGHLNGASKNTMPHKNL